MKAMMIFLITILGLCPLLAQSPDEAVRLLEDENGIGARAEALGNAYVAAADDWTALYWNPAALTLLKSSEISGAMYANRFNNTAHFRGMEYLGDKVFNQFKSFGLAYKFPTTQGSFAIAIGRHHFKELNDYLSFRGYNDFSNGLDFDLSSGYYPEYYSFDKNVQQREEVIYTGNLGAWSFGSGIQLSPNFSFGLTMHILGGSSDYQLTFFQEDVDNHYSSYPANFDSYTLHQTVQNKYSGWYASLGTLLFLSEELRAGISIDFPMHLKIDELWTEDDILLFDDGYEDALTSGPGEWDYIVRYPKKISGGLALDTRSLLVAVSASYRDWTETQFEVPTGYFVTSDYEALLDENVYFKVDFRPVLSWGAGGELRVQGTGVKLRGGYRLAPSPLKDAQSDLDRHYISGGIGFDLDKTTSLNISYTRGYWTRYSEDNLTPGGTKESIETDKVLGGITFRF